MSAEGPEFVHTVVECAKLAFADREAWYGDPNFFAVPTADLLAPDYAKQRLTLVGQSASLEFRPGSPAGRRPPVARPTSKASCEAAGTGEPTVSPVRGDTCHIDVIDRRVTW